MQKWVTKHSAQLPASDSGSEGQSGCGGTATEPAQSDRRQADLSAKPAGGVRSGGMGITGECPMANGATVCPHKAEVRQLQQEVTLLRRELSTCRTTITQLSCKEKQLRDRLSDQAQKHFMKGSTKFENLSLGENRPSQLVQRFRDLYSEGRLDAYDALDEIPEISEFDELKGKLLFSVVVLAFRSAQHSLEQVTETMTQVLRLPSADDSGAEAADPMITRVRDVVDSYLQQSINTYDISSIVQEVSQQVYATLYDYPRLKQCQRLQHYIKDCVRLAWALSVQTPPLMMDYDAKLFKEDAHTRFHSSNPESNLVKSMLWPGLLEGQNGPCVAKGVVIT